MVTVACVLRSGGDFAPQHVYALQKQARRFIGGRFVCLSDVKLDCETIPLETNWPGWWAKLELFKIPFDDTVLYFDLDMVLRRRLDDVATYPHRFTIGRNWKGGYNSAFMAWNGDYSRLYTEFSPSLIRQYRTPERWGDQGYIEDRVEAEDAWSLFPGFVSYKKHCRPKIPDEARVICFHGRPRPWACGVKWIEGLYARA
jgi:hypothetical protein